MHENTVNRKYFLEFAASMALYALVLVASITFGRPMPDGALRIAVLASPMLGVLALVWTFSRHMKRIDEFLRRSALEALAIAGAVTAGATFTYGFLESAGYPRLSMFTVLPLFCFVWGVVTCVRNALQR